MDTRSPAFCDPRLDRFTDMTPIDTGDWRNALPPGAPTDDSASIIRVTVALDQLQESVERLTPVARLADMFADQPPQGDPMLRLAWALDGTAPHYVVTETPCPSTEYPTLSDVAPAAFIEECEIYEQFGLRPAGGEQLNRVALPPHADIDFPRLGHPPMREAADVRAPHAVGGTAFEFPVGPVRAAGWESLYYGLVTSGEEVVDVYLFTWHKYRGIEWRLTGMDPRQGLFLIERVEGLSALAHGWSFAAAIEAALAIPVSDGANGIRAAALELERIYNHVAAIAAICQSTGLAVGQAGAEIVLEQLLRLGAKFFGHRYLFGLVDIGGVTRTVDLPTLSTEIAQVCGELRRVTDALNTTNSFLDRLEATGIITADRAHQLGLVGPVARASGINIDTRRDHPTVPYIDRPVTVQCRSSGDVLARYQVFQAEIDESLGLIDELAARAAEPGKPSAPTPRAGTGLGWTESARGEALTWVELDSRGNIARARVRPAAVRNWRAFDDAARAQNVFTDIPIIEASFWLTVAGRAR
jgi:Ni,Fe-hydrogenase III large subunit/Ni,Fe-hydrogenase III component G